MQGGSTFGKSERPDFFSKQNVPGPGYYEPNDTLNSIKRRQPVPLFSKSPKQSIFEKALTDTPGAIYHPTIHFTSKSKLNS